MVIAAQIADNLMTASNDELASVIYLMETLRLERKMAHDMRLSGVISSALNYERSADEYAAEIANRLTDF